MDEDPYVIPLSFHADKALAGTVELYPVNISLPGYAREHAFLRGSTRRFMWIPWIRPHPELGLSEKSKK